LLAPIPHPFPSPPTSPRRRLQPRYGGIRRGGRKRQGPQRRGLRWRRPTGGGGGHAPRRAPQLRRRRLLAGRRRRRRGAAAAEDQGGVLRDRPAAARGVEELGAGPARVDQKGQRPPRHPRHLGWNDHTYCIDWPSNLHVLPAGCNHQCCCCFRPDVAGSCWRIPGYVLCLLGCSVYWSSISCCFCHFRHSHLSNCRRHDCYWLAWILLDDLVCCKEEHGPHEALDRRDKFGYPVILCFSPCKAEAYRLRRSVIRL
ncbi:Os08g0425800, partial [Oryza sativa Japonica Group]